MTDLKKILTKNTRAASSGASIEVRAKDYNKAVDTINALDNRIVESGTFNPSYNTFFAMLWQKSAPNLNKANGFLIVGSRYKITTYVANDDFTNVGAASNAQNIEFIATGDTPAHWTHGSILKDYGDITVYEYHNNTDYVVSVLHNAEVGDFTLRFTDPVSGRVRPITTSVTIFYNSPTFIRTVGYFEGVQDDDGNIHINSYDNSNIAADLLEQINIEVRIITWNTTGLGV
jgi:hypothetical protein